MTQTNAQQLDEIFETIDELAEQERWEDIDRRLETVSKRIPGTTPAVLIGYLTITYDMKKHLKKRDTFYKSVVRRMRDTFPHDRAESLTKGLE